MRRKRENFNDSQCDMGEYNLRMMKRNKIAS
ncbi:hypothetical protein T11_7617 [Trichinella zimbabwensis]|uniref:Uncharacterized protein n=1 Tax=Trichinella zimbabwensis TaxID=268475 RepID=A0A0V1G932_9BILA|nr:hypothetical protein T11_7617 [Trichinella zimbabwensis]